MHGPLSPRGAFVGVAGRRGALIVGGVPARRHPARQHLRLLDLALRSDHAEPAQHAAAAELGASVRHRQLRPRRLLARAACGQARPADRLPLRALPVDPGLVLGAHRRLFRRLRRHGRHAHGRHLHGIPLPDHGDRRHRRARAGHHQHVHRADPERLEHLCAHRAGRGAGRAQGRVRARGARARLHRRAHPAAPHPAERHHADRHLRDDRHRAGDPVDGDA